MTRVRYPLRKGREFLPPSRLYSEVEARELLEEAERVVSRVGEILSDLEFDLS